MKALLLPTFAAVFLTWGASASAQQVVTERTTTYTGTVSDYEPVRQTLIVRQEASAPPVTYNVTQATTFVDEDGNQVRADRIIGGLPVVVHYVSEGDRMIASRVIVKRVAVAPGPTERTVVERKVTVAPAPVETTTQRTTVTTTTGDGTITSYTPGSPTLVLRSPSAPQPLTYSVSKTTTFVDESGAPIAVETISPGVPVTVHYVQEGDQLVASRVVVVRDPKMRREKLSDDEKDALKDLEEARREKREKRKDGDDDDN